MPSPARWSSKDWSSGMLEVPAPAKINLGLEILGRRADGYHDIVTILQEIDLADRLTFEIAEELTLTCAGLPANETNLVLRAARLLQSETGSRTGAAIRLEKSVPIAAGLGGGSSDAAATLRALNCLWRLDLSAADLASLAARLGADVPFFLRGGTQIATGIGTDLQRLPTPRLWVVLLITSVGVADKTRRLYGALRGDDFSNGDLVRDIAAAIGRAESLAGRALPSGFARAALNLAPEIETAMGAVREHGGIPSLCGAGPTLISLHADAGGARSLAKRLRLAGLDARAARARQASEGQLSC